MNIDELEAYFKSKELPQTLKINRAITITNVPRYIESHLAIIRNYQDKQTFKGFYNRLIELKEILEQ